VTALISTVAAQPVRNRLLLDEARSSSRVHEGHLAGLRALISAHRVKHAIVVSLERQPRRITRGFDVLPWETLLQQSWAGDL
jgi:hypothetical protein